MQRQNEQDGLSKRGSFNLGYGVMRALESIVAPGLRINFGEEYLGRSGLWAMLLMLLLIGHTGSRWLLLYFYIWLVALLVQRLIRLNTVRKGRRIHSQHIGDSIFRPKEAATTMEIISCIAVGGLMMGLSPVLGKLLVVCGASIAICRGIEAQGTRRRYTAMRDAEIEARAVQDARERW